MRNIKTAISIMICYLLASYVFHVNPFFACAAALISMQGSIDDSVKAAVARMFGTVMGGLLGIAVYFLDLKLFNHINLTFLTVGIGSVMIVFVMNLFRRSGAISTAMFVFFAVMFTVEDSVLLYAVERIFQTFIGIIVALLVNRLIVPPKTA